ncbi:MAG: polyamine aminopropyltransferase [Saprospiraceae bacterium]
MTQGKAAREKLVLIISIFIAGLCSIIYELLISTTSSYFLGDSIRQFSITIGIYMAAMGLGSYVSRLAKGNLILRFIEVELLLGIIGGSSVPLLYFAFAFTDATAFSALMIILISLIGALTGLEIPLLARILKDYYPLEENLSNVLSLDYLGALIATLLFPFLLLPFVGVFHSSLLFGALNVGLGIFNLWFLREQLPEKVIGKYKLFSFASIGYFIALFLMAAMLLAQWNDRLFRDRIIYSQSTPYQTLVLTEGKGDLRLYIDRVIQFSSVDEYRYHESLVHPAMERSRRRSKVLILGGGEGLAAREVLKHKDVEEVTIVDIDPAVFAIGRTQERLKKLNQGSLDHPKVQCIPEDAFVFLQQYPEIYDVIIADLPDPSNEAIARLYSRDFFKLVRKRLSPSGVFVTQASSPFHTKMAYWCIAASIQAAGFKYINPYHAYIPSFGDWGFILASPFSVDTKHWTMGIETKFLDPETASALFQLEKDLLPTEKVDTSTLDKPILLDYFLADWRRWSRENIPLQ